MGPRAPAVGSRDQLKESPFMSRIVRPVVIGTVALLTLAGCAARAGRGTAGQPDVVHPAVANPAAAARRSLASFAKSNTGAPCFDRKTEPYTAVVDVHFHPRPFGGQAISPPQLFDYFDRTGVRFVNYFGIGQSLDMASSCTYYLDCPGTSALPSIKNDFVNGMEVKAFPHDKVHITLSMTFMDLADPEGIVDTIRLYDKEFPGMFRWAGELNVIKQALLKNHHEPATLEQIDRWAPFMKVLRDRGIPVTLHSDLGNDANPTEFVHLMKHVLQKYPDNKIVWAHMGLSKELTKMDPAQHIRIMKEMLDGSPNLSLDISWDVLYNAYHEHSPQFVEFFNAYAARILPGSDFVASRPKTFEQYAKEQEVTSRWNKALSDEAFRKIALGENYFRLLNLDYRAPEICR
jgi:predicted TIM-barrel fold metal-dependent hydrolase